MTILTILCQITPPRRYSPIRPASPAGLVSVCFYLVLILMVLSMLHLSLVSHK